MNHFDDRLNIKVLSNLSISLEKTLCREKKTTIFTFFKFFLEGESAFSTREMGNIPDKFTMRDTTFAEILENFSSEFETESVICAEISGTLEPAFLSSLLGEVPSVRVQNHSVSSYSRAKNSFSRMTANEFKLKSQGMSDTQFKAYEGLLYAMELPILAAHRMFPESFTLSQLKKAYKLAALKNHPDSGGCHESFLEIRKCYDILEGFAKT